MGSGYFHRPWKLLRISSLLRNGPINTAEVTIR